MKYVAFLPCRRGSQRVPDKNTRAFSRDGRSLLTIKLAQLAATERLDEIVVSSNDPSVLELAAGFARQVDKPIRLDERPDALGSSTTTTDELIAYVPRIIPSGHILWTHVTSPFVDSAVYERILERYAAALGEGYDSLMTACRVQTFLYSAEGPVNFDRSVLKWPRTQTLPVWWEVDSAAFIVERELCARLGDRIGERPLVFELDHERSFDIDTQSQFELGAKLWDLSHADEALV
jgi:CMP-N-acetylneuraminic acid synthetase